MVDKTWMATGLNDRLMDIVMHAIVVIVLIN